ncbi:MAG: hypothetical protein GX560_04700 [Deinococcales bacterium]|nr:hypothetical protein [Deinococcales bacterium]
MAPSLRVTVVPLVGPFHTRFPLYTVVHVRSILERLQPEAVALASLPPGALGAPGWQATPEIALPHTVVPWARRRGVPLVEVASVAGGPGEPGNAEDAERFERFLSEFEAGRAHLRQVQAALRPVQELLGRALDLGRIRSELLPAIAAYEAARVEEYGEGPGTGWAAERAARVAERVRALPYRHVALLAGVDDLPALTAALAGTVELADAPDPAPDPDEARTRALLDVAMRGEVEDPAPLLAQLRELDLPEARYHQANLLLAHAHVAEALELLQGVAAGDFQEPYYLPGFVLARLGQLCDLAGDRAAALRAYRGALALDYAPPEAEAAARAGLAAPFEWPTRP